jgi:hypothetical protein
MTLPQNVADALKSQDQSAEDSPYDESAWQTIRAHLMSQEAEIDELVRALTMCTDRAKRAESRLAAANAQLRLMHRVLSQAVCVACADDGSAKDHELDKLEGVLRDQGWITTAVVPSTPTDEHLQGAGDEADRRTPEGSDG